jgi:dTDP-glucose pyrophosphorylase
MRILVCPAAGFGTRFSRNGYKLPKPLIMCNGAPMFVRAIEPLMPFVDRAYIIFSQMMQDYVHAIDASVDLNPKLEGRVDRSFITPQLEGAAMTVLTMQGLVNDSDEIVIVNSDQVFEDPDALGRWFRHIDDARPDGSILVFTASGPQWSYVRPVHPDEESMFRPNAIAEVAEKQQISDLATCGAYYFRSWVGLRRAICRMVADNDRTNNEFYLAPAYNHLMYTEDVYVSYYEMPKAGYWCVGTPELLKEWEAHDGAQTGNR